MAIKHFDFTNYPVKKTTFEIWKEGKEHEGKKWFDRVDDYITEIIRAFPSAKEKIVAVETDNEETLIKLKAGFPKYEEFLSYFNAFNNEKNIKTPAKEDTSKLLADLFKADSADSGLKALLKEQATDQIDLINEQLKRWEAGVLGIVFMLDSFKDFYLKDLPADIEAELNQPEPVKLSDLDQEKLKENIDDIFATLYTGITNTEKQEDLNDFFKDINANLDKIKILINSSRKPKEPEKPQNTQELTDLKNELTEIYAYIDGVLEKQSQQPVYILTEEPESMTRQGEKPNPNYLIFEEELLKHPLIKDKIQERINKRKFSTPISISKDKPAKPDDRPNITQQDYQNLLNNQEKHKPEDLEKHTIKDLKPDDYDTNISKLNDWQTTFPNQKPSEIKGQLESKPADQQPKPTPEQISKAEQYDQFASLFPDNKVPSNIKELWQSLNDRPNVSQSDYNNLLQQAQQAGVKPEELKLLLKDNWEYLKGHINELTKIIKRAVPTSTPDLSGSSSESKPPK